VGAENRDRSIKDGIVVGEEVFFLPRINRSTGQASRTSHNTQIGGPFFFRGRRREDHVFLDDSNNILCIVGTMLTCNSWLA
jgi:hypothetical protein